MASPLESCGKPLFFKVADSAEPDLGPDSDQTVRVVVQSLTLMQKEALVVSKGGGPTWRLSSDEGAYLMGDDVAPCPLSFVTTGMLASYMNEVLALANERDISIQDIKLTLDNTYTMSGSALRGTMQGGALPVELNAMIDSENDPDSLLQLVKDAVSVSVVNGLLGRALENRFNLVHNGVQVETGRVSSIGNSSEPDFEDRFRLLKPVEGDWDRLVRRAGMSPRSEEKSSQTGSSYADHQERQLHLRGTCTLRADGVKEIEQHLYNPHGSIFHFLSDEQEGRAPDAEAYISAGIAFCFMTQFGRYAKNVKKDLKEYRITQDIQFTRGSCLGNGVQSGAVEPVETHVYLVTNEEDDFAREMLDMAEQTCFLHALCRTELGTNIHINEYGVS